MSGASDLNNRFKMISINNRTTSTKWLPLNKGYFFLSRRTVHTLWSFSINDDDDCSDITVKLSNFVALIPTCLKCQRDWRISLELNSWDRAQVYKEKEKFVLVNYVSHKKPHRKISRHKCRAVMAKKFTKKTDSCTKLSFYSLNRNFLMFSLPLLSWV